MDTRFYKIEQRPDILDISYIRSVVDERDIEQMILIPGKLRTLFGSPNAMSMNSENWFEYYIEADGHYFEVYGVSTDTHIGGDTSQESHVLADQLAELINRSKASDYLWTSYYMDAEVKEIFEVREGKAIYQTQQLALSDEEFSRLYEEVFGLS